MVAGLRTSLKIGFLSAIIFTSGCVSNSQSGLYGGNFDHEEAAKTRMSLGLTYLQNNNYTQAKKNLDKALEFNPRSADVQFAMAYYYQLVGDNLRAEEYYETAIDLAPNNGDIANSYGAFKCQNGEYEKAKAYFFDAINNRLYANAAQTYENLALCAQSQGKLDEAIGYFQDALKHQPARGKSLFLLSELYTVSEQWELAESTLRKYERVAKVTPDSLWLAYEIAKGKGDLETAKGYGEMMMSLFPESELTKRYIMQRESMQNRVVKTVKSTQLNDSETEISANQTNTDGLAQTSSNDKENEKSVAQDNDALRQSQSNNTDNAPTATANTPEKAQNTELSVQSDKFHVVKEGENLYRISLLHNIKMATLQEWNNLENTGAIIAGQTLWLVPPSMQEE
ncbi:MAG: type IV pilus biogenesis/stability protein PilW [Pseudomonadota bacterium]|uniref:type IV pilus biogenesis/stability protein PilW n=1 Tax=Alteromonas TaxID=226 RepID=UPI00066D703C|nr:MULTISPECIES: type IV pilus biogenesis/stability protein PilW [Alteromonas]MED6325431.1 type IV pilus biogenesis/stability protein PilW [Pseudomonadota bacterium]MCG7642986.1 type IV pilus biogenesis/stability protein PilW [Alteromonas sp. MmMcT2-2]MEE3028410.1 type IV pilus biogenesis/stability protein PilW [Pseudomonadota bacterium]CAI3963836.1 type IV pilus assembly protein PilF [Alteromonas macleodii]VTP54120.1 type IV pilus assembly protein PilF [Alteromonas macleodii]|tara:strand:+ start:1379 stop:2569 length:1191 start_codon:yes stop_codon:yes gene_type:complete